MDGVMPCISKTESSVKGGGEWGEGELNPTLRHWIYLRAFLLPRCMRLSRQMISPTHTRASKESNTFCSKERTCADPDSSQQPGHRTRAMSRPTSREDVLSHLRAVTARGEAIVGAGAGTGLSAKCIENGGGHLIIIYNSGRFRMAGRGSLAGLMPYGDANKIVIEMVCLSHTRFYIELYP